MILQLVNPFIAHSAIARWLHPLDALPLECDGMTHVIAAILNRTGISYTVFKGVLHDTSLPLSDSRASVVHLWIGLPDGAVVDYRARMWFGPDAPHGVFTPSAGSRYQYKSAIPQPNFCLPISLVSAMAEKDLSDFPVPPIEAIFHYDNANTMRSAHTVH
ncbi:hypothetical protein ACEN2T_17190 [Pseudomonas sp. W22_MBD1_FP4]|uniref:hypothetical protein n=1 Tax=Pseudomonas sp. W22_MBD1_FP4 TaxID=3240272 RepID=UPI003F9E82F5